MSVFACRGAVRTSPYSTKLFHRAIGVPARRIHTYAIRPMRSGGRIIEDVHGRRVFRTGIQEPFMPGSFKDEFHYGKNSLCFMTQIAHLLGAGQIYALGFTLQPGSPYFLGRMHPLRGQPSIYDVDAAVHWLSWYEQQHPGKLKLLPGFQGPVYDVLQTEDLDGYRTRLAVERPEPTVAR